MSEQKPRDAECQLSGLYYKIGRFGMAYYWNGEEWIRSTKDSGMVEESIKQMKKF